MPDTKHVLVVDDDGSIRELVGTLLRREGFEVDDVESGNAAIASLTGKEYDAVVLDLMMRDGSGHDVLRAVAAQRPHAKCVVVISATSAANIEAVNSDNVVAKLRKPFDITSFSPRSISAWGSEHAPVDGPRRKGMLRFFILVEQDVPRRGRKKNVTQRSDAGCPHGNAQQRSPDAAPRVRRLPDRRSRGVRARSRRCAQRRLPPSRHRRVVRQRGSGRQRDQQKRRAP